MTDDPTPIPAKTVNITSGIVPSAGACAGCGTRTDTGFGIWGDDDWCREVLGRCLSRSDAESAVVEAAERDYGKPLEEIREMGFGVRLCLDCAHKSSLMVRLFTEGEGVLMYPQAGASLPSDLAALS